MTRHAAPLLAAFLLGPAALAEPAPPAVEETGDQYVCRLIEAAATVQALPVAFFTRLIWRESSFRADVVSPKGAQGIAQFMPGTAAERGLADPFDPETAIPASAALLADLRASFGNLGLAAAAYNAGPARVGDWLADSGSLPYETQEYVLFVTGRLAEDWAGKLAGPPPPPEADGKPAEPPPTCLTIAAELRQGHEPPGLLIATTTAPWGVQVAGSFSRARALAGYVRVQARHAALLGDRPPVLLRSRLRSRGTRPFYRVRVPAETRKDAEDLCARLRRAGGSCIVLKN